MILVNYRSRQAAHGENKIVLIILDNLGLQERRRPALSSFGRGGIRHQHPALRTLILLIRKGRSRPSTVPGLYERDPERTPESVEGFPNKGKNPLRIVYVAYFFSS